MTLGRSRLATACLALAMASTFLVLALTPFDSIPKIVLALAVALAARETHARIALQRGPRAVTGFRVDRAGAIEVDQACGRRQGVVRAGCLVAPWLTIVRWRPEGARFDRTILILPDMLAHERFRELRVLLRWS